MVTIKLSGFNSPRGGGDLDGFIEDYLEGTLENPFNDRVRMYGPVAITLSKFGREIHLSDITTLTQQKQGQGTAALTFLKHLADKHKVTISGTALAYSKDRRMITTTNRLVQWYKKNGFVVTGGTADDGYHIEYKPKTAEASTYVEHIVGNLTEANFDRVTVNPGTSREKLITCYKNPSGSTTLAVLQRSKEKELRGIIVGSDVYVWDSYYSWHYDMAEQLDPNFPNWNKNQKFDINSGIDGKTPTLAYDWREGVKMFSVPGMQGIMKVTLIHKHGTGELIPPTMEEAQAAIAWYTRKTAAKPTTESADTDLAQRGFSDRIWRTARNIDASKPPNTAYIWVRTKSADEPVRRYPVSYYPLGDDLAVGVIGGLPVDGTLVDLSRMVKSEIPAPIKYLLAYAGANVSDVNKMPKNGYFLKGRIEDDREIFSHEMIHYQDMKRAKGTIPVAASNDDNYFNSPLETNAYYQEAISRIDHKPASFFQIPFREFVRQVVPLFHGDFLQGMNDDTQKRIIKRLYQTWVSRQ